MSTNEIQSLVSEMPRNFIYYAQKLMWLMPHCISCHCVNNFKTQNCISRHIELMLQWLKKKNNMPIAALDLQLALTAVIKI